MKPRIYLYYFLGLAILNALMNEFVAAVPQRGQPESIDEVMVNEWPVGFDRNTLVDMLGQDTGRKRNKGPETDSSSSSSSNASNKNPQEDINIVYASTAVSGIDVRSSSQLQRQEEQDLERLDKSILDTLQLAVEKTQQNQPIRRISIEEATSQLLQSHSRWAILSSHWASWTLSLLWFCIMVVVAISLLVLLGKKNAKQLSSRDCHPHLLPSFTVCKQKCTVD